MNHLSIAIDGGHSMFKIRASSLLAPEQRISFQIPTVVIPAFNISNEETRVKSENDRVELNGRHYFIGETAVRQGNADVFTGQNKNWILTSEHDAMILGSWQKVMDATKSQATRIHLVMGLPAKYFNSQKVALQERVYSLLRPRLLQGQTLKVFIQSQADAPLQYLAINKSGRLNSDRNLDQESWGVIEIGHFTTDFALSESGSMIERASVSSPGMYMVYEAVSTALVMENMPTAVTVIDKIVRQKTLNWNGVSKDMSTMVKTATSGFEALVLDHADRIFGQQAGLLNGILVGGGGAELIFASIKVKFPSAILGEDPRMMVVEGFCRLGLMSLLRK